MQVRLLSIGERMPPWVAQGVAEYRKRLAGAMPVELVELRQARRGKGLDPVRAKAAEGDSLLAAVPVGAELVALDGGGQQLTSEQLAGRLADWRMQGRDLALAIGGADGHASSVLDRAALRWSLGSLTLPHMLVRLLVLEQLYRANSILAGHPYHRG